MYKDILAFIIVNESLHNKLHNKTTTQHMVFDNCGFLLVDLFRLQIIMQNMVSF